MVLADGTIETYDRLVLATGARNWVPPIVGADLAGVYTLRSLEDARLLRECADRVSCAVMIGGGLLGLDMSAALRAHHIEVTVVEALPWLLPRQLDREGAAVLQQAIEQMGITVVTGDQVAAIAGDGRVERLELKSGRAIPAEMVVVSTGIRSNLTLAQGAGLACNRGVVVDEQLRTSHPDIYAVGDVAEFAGRVWGIIPAAIAQARAAAAQITGRGAAPYADIVPSTTLKVTGIDVASIGEVHPRARVIPRFAVPIRNGASTKSWSSTRARSSAPSSSAIGVTCAASMLSLPAASTFPRTSARCWRRALTCCPWPGRCCERLSDEQRQARVRRRKYGQARDCCPVA